MKKIRGERGQSLVELAISITFILLLLAGAVELGMALFQYIQLRDAAQEGALYASLNPTNASGIDARTRGASSSPIKLSDTSIVIITITYEDSAGNPLGGATDTCEGDGVKVDVKYDHVIFMPFANVFTSNGKIPLEASVTDTILKAGSTSCVY